MATVLPGFRPVKFLNGAAWNGQVNRYMISASDTQATNVGDLVQLSDNAALEDASGSGAVYPAVERINLGTAAAIVGVIVGFEPAPFLPMSREEMDQLGWDACDFILVCGDAYIDHPSFVAGEVASVTELAADGVS